MVYDRVNKYVQLCKKCYIKLNNHLEGTKVSVPFTKPNAEQCVLSEIFISDTLFRFSSE